MTSLEEATEAQLRQELERRVKEREELAKQSRMALSSCAPQRLETIDTTDLVECCEQYRDFLTSEDYHEDRLSKYEHAIMEAAVGAVFGDEFWDWVDEAMG